MAYWLIEYVITGDGTICVEADTAAEAQSLVLSGEVDEVLEDAEIDTTGVSHLKMYVPGVLRGVTVTDVARKDGAAKGSPSMVIIDTMQQAQA